MLKAVDLNVNGYILKDSELEVLNDNELNNDCYEIYVVNDQIYYIGINAEICKMDLNGANKAVVADYGTGFLGITKDYIIYNSKTDKEDEYVTYIMNIDGTDAKPIIEGKRIYSVNIEGKYIYYELNASILEEVLLWIYELKGEKHEKKNLFPCCHVMLVYGWLWQGSEIGRI